MPFFEHSHGVHIHGGNFYDVAGGMNVEQEPLGLAVQVNQQHLALSQDDSRLTEGTSAEDSWPDTFDEQSSGVQGSMRNTAAVRYTPYSECDYSLSVRRLYSWDI